MFTTNKEIFNKINNVIDNYNNYTFEWLFEDLFNKPNKQFSIKKAEKEISQFINNPKMDKIETKFSGKNGAIDIIKQYSKETGNLKFAMNLDDPYAIIQKINWLRAYNFMQSFLDGNYLDWYDEIDDRKIEMFRGAKLLVKPEY